MALLQLPGLEDIQEIENCYWSVDAKIIKLNSYREHWILDSRHMTNFRLYVIKYIDYTISRILEKQENKKK